MGKLGTCGWYVLEFRNPVPTPTLHADFRGGSQEHRLGRAESEKQAQVCRQLDTDDLPEVLAERPRRRAK